MTTLAAFGALLVYMWASMDVLPRRAFSRAHDRIKPGLSAQEAAAILLELMESSGGNFRVVQLTPEGRARELASKSLPRSAWPSAAALAAHIDRSQPVHVWMNTFNLSGQFTFRLDADGVVHEVSKIDGHVK